MEVALNVNSITLKSNSKLYQISRSINKILSLRLTMFDSKEESKLFFHHSLQGALYIIKTINKIDVNFYQEAVEIFYHILVKSL